MSDEAKTEVVKGELVHVGEPAPQQHALMRPVASPALLIDVHREMTSLIREALVEGTDYGMIPGTERSGKKTLLKPGAERLAIAFGAFPRYTIVEREIDHDREVPWVKRQKVWGQKRGEVKGYKEERGTSLGLYRYVIRCELVRRCDDVVVGDGLGSCSTLESKYIDRPRDCENTVLKMAEKRAMVAAVLNAFGLSDRFTQDCEDSAVSDDGEERKPAPKSEAPAEKPGNGSREMATRPQMDRLLEWCDSTALPEAGRTWLRGKVAEGEKRGGLTKGEAGALIAKVKARLAELNPPERPPTPPSESDAPADQLPEGL